MFPNLRTSNLTTRPPLININTARSHRFFLLRLAGKLLLRRRVEDGGAGGVARREDLLLSGLESVLGGKSAAELVEVVALALHAQSFRVLLLRLPTRPLPRRPLAHHHVRKHRSVLASSAFSTPTQKENGDESF